MSRGVGGHSPANVQKFLKGQDYPADKKDLIEPFGVIRLPRSDEVDRELA
jgi:hypothetical protein